MILAKLVCDRCGRETEHRKYDSFLRSSFEGWEHRGSKDYCPDHRVPAIVPRKRKLTAFEADLLAPPDDIPVPTADVRGD